jgi:phosphate transport system substrate-binding protein
LKGFAFQRRKLASVSAAVLAVGASTGFISTAVASAASGGTLNGAGSTLVAPLEAEWASAFQSKTGNLVNYNPVGSGTGIADISAGTVDFGASDAPLSPSQAAGCHNCIQIPWALSATGVGYNVPGAGRKLHLTGPLLAQIYLGHVTNWNDPQIARVNRGVHLPNLKITPVFRSDGSGDTYAFTNYLTQVSSAWKGAVGLGTSVSFPTGASGKGNSGVTAVLQGTPGSVAYIAVSYLIAHQLPAVGIQNRAGKFEYPNLSNIENAAAVVKHVPSSMQLSIVNPPKSAKIAYPISTFTYVIAPTTAPQGGLLKSFVQYALGPGHAFGANLDFAPLPKVVVNADKAAAGRL